MNAIEDEIENTSDIWPNVMLDKPLPATTLFAVASVQLNNWADGDAHVSISRREDQYTVFAVAEAYPESEECAGAISACADDYAPNISELRNAIIRAVTRLSEKAGTLLQFSADRLTDAAIHAAGVEA